MSTYGVEPRPIIPALAPFYETSRDLSWLVVRLTAGGFLLIHGLLKLTSTTVAAFAANSLAKRGIEPSLPLAYAVFLIESVGALCIMAGFLTRFWAAVAGVHFLVIVFVATWPNGFAWTSPRGGWEFPMFWGLIILAIGLRGGGPYSLDRRMGREL